MNSNGKNFQEDGVLDLSNGVRRSEIWPEEYENCNILKLYLQDNLKVIRYDAFRDNFIEDLKLPVGLQLIERGAFANNRIKYLELPAGVRVGNGAFAHNNIEKLVINGNVEKIAEGTFVANPLKEVTLSVVEDIEEDNFPLVETLNFRYITVDYLDYFLKNLVFCFPSLKTINVSFIFSLSLLESKRFNYICKKYNNLTINEIKYIYQEPTKINENEDKEINELVGQIKTILDKYNVPELDKIRELVDELLKDYDREIKSNEPQLDFQVKNEISLTLDEKSKNVIRKRLILKLNDIVLVLSENRYLLNYLEKLNNLMSEDRIKELLSLKDFFKDSIEEELNTIISNGKKEIIDNILNSINFGISSLIYIDKTDDQINSLCLKYFELYENIKPYLIMLDSIKELNGNTSISKYLLDFRRFLQVLDKYSDEKFNKLLDDLINKSNEIIKDNIQRIKKNENEILSINDIELLIRKELDLLLRDLLKNDYININYNKLVDDLNESITYLNGKEVNNIDNNAILSTILEIERLCKDFNDFNKKSTNNQILNILLKYQEILSNKDEYNKLITKYKEEHQDMMLPNDISILELIILNELMNILINVQEYKNELEEYNSLSNKSVNRL